MLKINIRVADDRIETVPFEDDDLIIGRDETSGIRLPDRNVSRRHARLEKDADDVFVEDLQSSFGTYINDRRMESGQRARLQPGDLLRVGYNVVQVEGLEENVDLAATAEAELVVEFESEADAPLEAVLEVQVVNADTDPVGYPVHTVSTSIATPVAHSLVDGEGSGTTYINGDSIDDEWDVSFEPPRRGSRARLIVALILVLAAAVALIYFLADELSPSHLSFDPRNAQQNEQSVPTPDSDTPKR